MRLGAGGLSSFGSGLGACVEAAGLEVVLVPEVVLTLEVVLELGEA